MYSPEIGAEEDDGSERGALLLLLLREIAAQEVGTHVQLEQLRQYLYFCTSKQVLVYQYSKQQSTSTFGG